MLDGHQYGITSLNFSTDDRLLISSSVDKAIRIWDMVDGSSKVLRTNLHDPFSGVISTTISPNGQYIAAGDWDDGVHIWDVQTEQLVEVLHGHRNSVVSVAFMPDGKGLVSGSWDKTLKLWDLSTLGVGLGAVAKGAKDKKSKDQGDSSLMNFTGHNVSVCSSTITMNQG